MTGYGYNYRNLKYGWTALPLWKKAALAITVPALGVATGGSGLAVLTCGAMVLFKTASAGQALLIAAPYVSLGALAGIASQVIVGKIGRTGADIYYNLPEEKRRKEMADPTPEKPPRTILWFLPHDRNAP